MRTPVCTLSLGWRNLGFAFPERNANPMVHTHAGLAKPRFCMPRTRCEPCGAHPFLDGEPKFCMQRTRGGPYGTHSFCVGEINVLQSQNERRTIWCTLSLACRNLRFAFPERDANRVVHTHSGFAKSRFLYSEIETRTLWCTLILSSRQSGLEFPERDANPLAPTHILG